MENRNTIVAFLKFCLISTLQNPPANKVKVKQPQQGKRVWLVQMLVVRRVYKISYCIINVNKIKFTNLCHEIFFFLSVTEYQTSALEVTFSYTVAYILYIRISIFIFFFQSRVFLRLFGLLSYMRFPFLMRIPSLPDQ